MSLFNRIRPTPAESVAPEQIHRSVPIGIILSAAFLVSTSIGFVMPLLALSLNATGFSPFMIGMNAAAPALGILAISPLFPHLALHLSSRFSLALSVIPYSGLVLLLAIWHGFWPWFLMRFFIGVAAGIFFIVAEAWLNALSTQESRGRLLSTYGSLSSLGFAIGPILLIVIGTGGFTPFIVGSTIYAVTILALLACVGTEPRIASKQSMSFSDAFRRTPVAMMVAFVSGFVSMGLVILLPIYGTQKGLSADRTLTMVTAVVMGEILVQPVLGVLADRLGARVLMTSAALLGLIAAYSLIIIDQHLLMWPMLLLLGGAAAGLYSLSLVVIGNSFSSTSLAAASAAVLAAYGLGNLIGPSAIGWSMTAYGPNGLLLTILCAVGGLFLILAFGHIRLRYAGPFV